MAATSSISAPYSPPNIPGFNWTSKPRWDPVQRGWRWSGETTVGAYLTTVGIYDPKTGQLKWEPEKSLLPRVQRDVLPERNKLKRAMFRDKIMGAQLPPMTLYINGGNHADGQVVVKDDVRVVVKVLDGGQRSHVFYLSGTTLKTLQAGGEVDGWRAEQLEEIRRRDGKLIDFQQLLDEPLSVTCWAQFENPSYLVRQFFILNAGQVKVKTAHLLDILGDDLKGMFESWGIKVVTQNELDAQMKLPPKKRVKTSPPYFEFSFLIAGTIAYLNHDPSVRSTSILEKTSEHYEQGLDSGLTEIGSAASKHDFVWACKTFKNALEKHYHYNESAKGLFWNDTFFPPLMAALGEARDYGMNVQQRQQDLIDFMDTAKSSDPLLLGRTIAADDEDDIDLKPEPRALYTVLSKIESSIGRATRLIIYTAFANFFQSDGPIVKAMPINWRLGYLSLQK
jgi:hypothetical protein